MDQNKHLLVLFSCLHPVHESRKIDFRESEIEYLFSLKKLLEIYSNSHFILLDNSIDNIKEVINKELKEILYKCVDNFPIVVENFYFHKYNNFTSDIGYIKLFLEFYKKMKYYGNIEYFTFMSLRRIMTSPYYFNEINKAFNLGYDCITVQNIKSSDLENDKIKYVDSLFSMNKSTLFNFLKYLSEVELKNVNKSDIILNQFINMNSLKYRSLKNVGLIENLKFWNQNGALNINLY